MTHEPPSPSDGPDPAWLPTGFAHPQRVDLRCGMHLRPIRAADAEIDHPAVMGSRESLWAKYGDAWAWPPPDMTLEQDREDLAHHEREIAAKETFNYAVLDEDETRLLGCIYLDPPGDEPAGDVIVSWWVFDECAGTPLDVELERFVPKWVTGAWPFTQPHFSP